MLEILPGWGTSTQIEKAPEPGRAEPSTSPGLTSAYISNSFHKGGGEQCSSFDILGEKGGVFLKSDSKRKLLPNNNCDSAALVIRAAALVRSGGASDLDSDNPTPAETLGITLYRIRRKKGYSLKDLASQTGYSEEMLMVLEAGMLSVEQIGEMLPSITASLGLDLRPHLLSLSGVLTEL